MPPTTTSPSQTATSLRLGERLALASLALLALAASVFSLRSTDVFWHLATGRFMAERLAIPRLDPFRFGPEAPLPWVDHEWAFQLLLHTAERLAGIDGLIALRAVLVLALAAVLAGGLRRCGVGVGGAVLLAALALLGGRPRFLLRPELLTFLAVAVELRLLRRLRQPGGERRTILGLVVLTVAWANVHGLALLAPVLAGGYLLGLALGHGEQDPRRRRLELVVAVPALLTVALLANPYGTGIFAVPQGITGALADLAAINPEWLPTWKAPQPALFVALAALGALVGDTAARVRRLDLPMGVVTFGMAVLALTAIRHQALFFLAGAFLAAETLRLRAAGSAPVASPAANSPDSPRQPAAALIATAACLLIAAWCAWPPAGGPLAPRQGRFELSRGIRPGSFPEDAVDLLARHPGIGPLYNELAHGGYLLWRLFPPRPVFLDGRMELEPGLLREIAAARIDEARWQDLLRRRGAVGALVRMDSRPRPVLAPDPQSGELVVVAQRTPNALLFAPSRWALVYWDDLVMLFLDRGLAANERYLGWEYAAVQPEDIVHTLERAASDPTFRAAALADVERRLTEAPNLARAAFLREQLLALPTPSSAPDAPPLADATSPSATIR